MSPQHSCHPICVSGINLPPSKTPLQIFHIEQTRFHVLNPLSPRLNSCPRVGAFLLGPSLGLWHRHARQEGSPVLQSGCPLPLPSALTAFVPMQVCPKALSPSILHALLHLWLTPCQLLPLVDFQVLYTQAPGSSGNYFVQPSPTAKVMVQVSPFPPVSSAQPASCLQQVLSVLQKATVHAVSKMGPHRSSASELSEGHLARHSRRQQLLSGAGY